MLRTEAPAAGLHINAAGPPVDADTTTIARWENLHAAYWRHRNGLAEHEEAMRTLAPAYCTAIHRARARYDAEPVEDETIGVE